MPLCPPDGSVIFWSTQVHLLLLSCYAIVPASHHLTSSWSFLSLFLSFVFFFAVVFLDFLFSCWLPDPPPPTKNTQNSFNGLFLVACCSSPFLMLSCFLLFSGPFCFLFFVFIFFSFSGCCRFWPLFVLSSISFFSIVLPTWVSLLLRISVALVLLANFAESFCLFFFVFFWGGGGGAPGDIPIFRHHEDISVTLFLCFLFLALRFLLLLFALSLFLFLFRNSFFSVIDFYLVIVYVLFVLVLRPRRPARK